MSYVDKEQLPRKGTQVPRDGHAKGIQFSERLKSVIPKKGIRELCRETGISYGAMQKYLSGTSSPKLDNLVLLADSLNVDIKWLATGKADTSETQHDANTTTANSNTSKLLIDLLGTLNQDEQNELARLFARKGVETVLYLLDESNIRLLQLPEEERERLLVRHEAKKGASEECQENELTHPVSKQVG